jgi:fumarylacetoacetase
LRKALVPQAAVTMGLPCRIGDYTDFYISSHHATAIGKVFRPDNPLLPNYNGCRSAITAGPRRSTRARAASAGRWRSGAAAKGAPPELLPTARLDFELELGSSIGRRTPRASRSPSSRPRTTCSA